MIAEIEQLDGTYKSQELPTPEGCFFCDSCGDCLKCAHDDGFCYDGDLARWVVYIGELLNPNTVAAIWRPTN